MRVMNRLNFLVFATVGFCSLWGPAARAQTDGSVVDLPTLTAGTAAGSGSGFDSGSFGSISPANTADGYHFAAFYDSAPAGKNGGVYHQTVFSVTGFAANPGQSWLTSAVANGVTFTGSSATYTYASGEATWIWTTGPAFIGKPSPAYCTILHEANSGWIRPKYQVVNVIYAPPGAKSTVAYASGFQSGTSNSNSISSSSGVTVTDTLTGGFKIKGVLNGTVTSTEAESWSQAESSSSSISVVQTSSTTVTAPGPLSSTLGVDHDFDTIYVWVNPEVFVVAGQSVVNVGGYGWDDRDPYGTMDVIPLTVGELKGTQAITDPNVTTRMNRAWDSLGALTSTDIQAILKADPFVDNPSFNPASDPTHRYELPESGTPPAPVDLVMNFVPAPVGGQAQPEQYNSTYTNTSTTGQTASSSQTVSYSVDADVSYSAVVAIGAKLGTGNTYTYSSQWSNTVSSGTSQSVNITIVPPLSTDDYVGLTGIQVWKDNQYGTYMFYPVN
jgi:hypothetical protein